MIFNAANNSTTFTRGSILVAQSMFKQRVMFLITVMSCLRLTYMCIYIYLKIIFFCAFKSLLYIPNPYFMQIITYIQNMKHIFLLFPMHAVMQENAGQLISTTNLSLSRRRIDNIVFSVHHLTN